MTTATKAAQWTSHAPINLSESTVGEDGFTRSWAMLAPERQYKLDGIGAIDFSEASLRAYKANFDAKAKTYELALDVDHQAPHAGKTQAYGWIERMELGEDIGRTAGLWAYVRWTPLGLTAVQGHIYRYISAEITPGAWHNDVTDKTHTRMVLGATLTNRPRLKDIEPIVLSEDDEESVGEGGGMAVDDLEQVDELDTEEVDEDVVDEEEQDEETEPTPAAPAAKLSERRTGTVNLAEHMLLVEKVKRLERENYVASVDKLLGGWDAGKQQFSESRGKVPNGDAAKPAAAGKPVIVKLSRPAFKAAKALMLSEEYAELSEAMRAEIGRVIELAATGAVDTSMRGGSHDTERQKTTTLRVVPAGEGATPDHWTAVGEEIKTLAEEKGIDFEELEYTMRGAPSPKQAEAAATYEGLLRKANKRLSEGA